MNIMEVKEFGEMLDTGDVAKALGVRIQVIERWIRDKKISALRLPSGRYRIARAELERIQQEGNIPREDDINKEVNHG